MLRLELVRPLIAVFDAGSVTGAARDLGYSPAAVSRHLANLQRLLAVTLFRPEGRGIRATEEAAGLVELFRDAMVHVDQLEEHLRSLRARSGGNPPVETHPAIARTTT